jgi:hypothetical protein
MWKRMGIGAHIAGGALAALLGGGSVALAGGAFDEPRGLGGVQVHARAAAIGPAAAALGSRAVSRHAGRA